MSNVTFEDVEQEVRRLVAENPYFIYSSVGASVPDEVWNRVGNGCYYRNGETSPGCVFGQAFLNLGAELTWADEGSAAADLAEGKFGFGMQMSYLQSVWTSELQMCQDGGLSWQIALESADRRVAGC